ncbi:hypothetical protein [Actinoplanes sp. NPDC026623]
MDTRKTNDRVETVTTYESVTAATMALGSKTYTGTVSAGGGTARLAPAQQ